VEQALGPGERDVNLEDRVKAVQHKAFLKTHRFGISGFGSASMSDAFFHKWGGGGALSFAFVDAFSLSLSYAYFHDQETENVLIAKQVLSSQLYATRLNQLATADAQWTPIYGKVELLNKIIYFDLYVLAGLGAANGATSWAPASEAGLGERVFLTDFLSVGAEGKYTFYVDQAAGGPSVLQKVLLMTGVLTIWFPGAAEGQ
jgi:outer membrane beta-barrel protein